MLNEDDWKLAIEDARKRHEAVTDLIFFTDTQAMHLLRLYLTLGVASSSAAWAGLSTFAPIPVATSCALIGAAVVLLIGSWYCFCAMETIKVGLPGRDPEFWIWAAHEQISREIAFRTYLANLAVKTAQNRQTNAQTAGALSRAKLLGVLAPAAALFSGGIALLFVA